MFFIIIGKAFCFASNCCELTIFFKLGSILASRGAKYLGALDKSNLDVSKRAIRIFV